MLPCFIVRHARYNPAIAKAERRERTTRSKRVKAYRWRDLETVRPSRAGTWLLNRHRDLFP